MLDRYIEGVVIDLKTNCELCETIICLWTLFTHLKKLFLKKKNRKEINRCKTKQIFSNHVNASSDFDSLSTCKWYHCLWMYTWGKHFSLFRGTEREFPVTKSTRELWICAERLFIKQCLFSPTWHTERVLMRT